MRAWMVCVHVCMHVCVRMYADVCMCVCMYACMHCGCMYVVCMYVCMYYVYKCVSACMYVFIHVCMHVCIVDVNVCMCACIYVRVHVCTYPCLHGCVYVWMCIIVSMPMECTHMYTYVRACDYECMHTCARAINPDETKNYDHMDHGHGTRMVSHCICDVRRDNAWASSHVHACACACVQMHHKAGRDEVCMDVPRSSSGLTFLPELCCAFDRWQLGQQIVVSFRFSSIQFDYYICMVEVYTYACMYSCESSIDGRAFVHSIGEIMTGGSMPESVLSGPRKPLHFKG
jgi:hypothetical protein